MNKREKITKLCNLICALLMAALIIMQFVPFWYSVGGEHMTDEQYLEWSKDYVPVAERPTESKAPTTEATTEAPTTEAPTTEAPTTEATDASADPTEETKKQPKNPFDVKNKNKNKGKDKVVKPPMPTEIPTDPEVRKISIAESVWRTNRYKKDMAAPLLMFHVAVLGVGAVGVFFCLVKRKASLNCVWGLLVSILATLGYFTNAAAQTGMNWMIHGILAVALLVPSVILLALFVKQAIEWFTKIEK